MNSLKFLFISAFILNVNVAVASDIDTLENIRELMQPN